MQIAVHYFKVFIFFLLCVAPMVNAHTFQPSNANVNLLGKDEFSFTLEVDLIELLQWQLNLKASTNDALIAQVKKLTTIELYKALAQSKTQLAEKIIFYFDDQAVSLDNLYAPSTNDVRQLLQQKVDNSDYRVRFYGFGKRPVNAKTLAMYFPEQLGVINFQLAAPVQALLTGGAKTERFILSTQQVSTLALNVANSLNYLWQGIVHIIPKGLDHILFVLALFLFSTRISSLLWQISAFTLAHTITLTLGIYGIVNIPSVVVEPVIALSIAYVAFENIVHQKLKSYRLLLVFVFGLLHGLGFASVLLELGLPKNQALSSLISFNIGVEVGQLAVVALAFIVVGWARNKIGYQRYIVKPISLFIALMGCYWFITRLAAG
jgi:hypothetical protein